MLQECEEALEIVMRRIGASYVHEAVEIIKRTCNVKSSQELQNIDIERRNRYIKHLKEQGLSTRQLERLTGISKQIVLKV